MHELGDVMEALVGLLAQRLLERVGDGGGEIGSLLGDARGRLEQVLAHQLAVGVAGERRSAREALVRDDGERVLVGAAVDAGPLELFGGHVARRAEGAARLGKRHVAERLGDAEVAHQHPAALLDHDVGGFDVAVHDAVAVRVLEGAAGLLEDADRFLEAQGAGLLEDLAEGAALDALHRVPEEGAGGADAVDGDDVGVIERGGDLGLALEALGGVGAVGELQRQDLERDGAVELDFVGEVDERHAAAAEELVDLELAAQVALQGALQLFGHGGPRRLVGDEGTAAVGAHDRVTGDVAGVAAGAGHGT